MHPFLERAVKRKPDSGIKFNGFLFLLLIPGDAGLRLAFICESG
jgi:hypothetical protein